MCGCTVLFSCIYPYIIVIYCFKSCTSTIAYNYYYNISGTYVLDFYRHYYKIYTCNNRDWFAVYLFCWGKNIKFYSCVTAWHSMSNHYRSKRYRFEIWPGVFQEVKKTIRYATGGISSNFFGLVFQVSFFFGVLNPEI